MFKNFNQKLLKYAELLPHSEFQAVLNTFFDNIRENGSNIYYSSNENSNVSLILTYNSEGNHILKIEFNESTTSSLSKRIVDNFESVCTHKPSKIGYVILLSTLPVTGYYKFNDEFQIIPIDEYLAQDRNPIRGNNPFILEFRYFGSDNFLVKSIREAEKVKEYELLLNILLKGKIIKANENFLSSKWVIENGNCKLLQLGYYSKNYIPSENDFSEISQYQLIPITDKFYSDNAVQLDEVLTIATFIPATLDIYFKKIDAHSKNLFLNSAYWYLQAIKHRNESQSAVNLFIAISLEALMADEPTITKDNNCPNCNILIGTYQQSITQKFSDFIDKYFPNDKLSSALKKEFYRKMRSKVAHGGILENDKNSILDFYPKAIVEDNTTQAFLFINKFIIIQWVQSKAN